MAIIGGCVTQNGGIPVSKKQDTARVMEPIRKNPIQHAGEVQVLVFFADKRIVLNQPLAMNFVIKNGLDTNIKLDLGQNFKESFSFFLSMPDGRSLRLPRLQSEGISLKGEITIASNQTYSNELFLNEWLDIDKPGGYVLNGRLETPITTENGESVEYSSHFSVKFNVEKEDREYLKKIADKYFERFELASSFQDAANAALALSYLHSEVAAPYLRRVLMSDKMTESVVINSLRKRGGIVSAEVLIGVIKEKPNSEAAAQAIAALSWIKAQTADVKLKELISHALNNSNNN
jgi:hypothetical protein